MGRRAVAVVFGVACAGAVAFIVQRDAGSAVFVLSTTALVAVVLLVVIGVRRSVGKRTDAVRVALACLFGLIAFFVILPNGCDDVGGVPDWRRCSSNLGNPTLEWRGGSWTPWKILYPILAPLLLGTAVGVLGWRVVGPPPADKRT
jgi:hypothetical protein